MPEGAQTAPSELPDDRKSPPLLAKVYTLAPSNCCEAISSTISEDLPLETFTSPSAFVEALSGEVAVVLLTTDASQSRLERLLGRTIGAAGHARVLLIASDSKELIDPPIPHDEAFVKPVDAEEFQNLVRRLYVRAYYEVTLERLYELSVAIRNREIQLESEEMEADDRLPRLRKSRNLMNAYLEQFNAYLGPEDLQAMETRSERLERLAADAKARNPSAVGLPDSCPHCNLDWTEWHGSRLRNGFRKIAADSWRCTQCGAVLSDTGPSDYQVR